MTNKNNITLYVGVTSNLQNRVYEHKEKKYSNSSTARYNLIKLVYFEGYKRIEEAIAREKQIKGSSRKKKLELINKFNPLWNDLYEKIDGYN